MVMSTKRILLYVVVCGVIGVAGWRVYSGGADLARLAAMPSRNDTTPYEGEQRIAEGLKIAKETGKYVLVQSSAQGCGWCHILHTLITTNEDIKAKIDRDFVYVLVDTTHDDDRSFYKKYAGGTDHTLVLAVLDTEGKELTQSIGFDIVQPDPAQTNSLHIAPAHIMEFLNQWSPKRAGH
jgi:hypothetical protein